VNTVGFPRDYMIRHVCHLFDRIGSSQYTQMPRFW
jgi:hypothetical protein